MSTLSPNELKNLLVARGFEVYQTKGLQVFLAERVRDNLLMDGNVAICAGKRLELRFTTRAQQGDFPTETEGQLVERARLRGAPAVPRGYREVDRSTVTIRDPGDDSKTLDTWYEVTFERLVGGVDELAREAQFALGLDKIA